MVTLTKPSILRTHAMSAYLRKVFFFFMLKFK